MQVIDTLSHASGSRTLPKGHRWVVVDVETSGLRAYAHRVLSVAALVLREDGSVEREYSTLVDPGCDPGPVHVHRLTRERLAGAPRFEQIAGEFAEVLAGGTIVAHNAAFDYGFLDAEFRRAGAEIPVKHRLCTLALSRRLELDVADHKLSTLAAHWQVQQLLEHDAYDDARVLSEVFVRSASLAESLQLPLPVVDCLSRRSAYPDSVPRVPCEWKNPGRLSLDVGLVQGMKVVITGHTTTPRVLLAGRMTDAGLDVMNSISRQTSVVVCNDPGVQTGKIRKAMAEGIPVVTEQQLEGMLTRVLPGEPKTRPVVEVAAPPAEPVITSAAAGDCGVRCSEPSGADAHGSEAEAVAGSTSAAPRRYPSRRRAHAVPSRPARRTPLAQPHRRRHGRADARRWRQRPAHATHHRA
ncbi:DNA polymerase III epsilon subunit family exonuclease [Rhodococcus ruber]|nr:DNA polymerase III epsilon subunit family exonuclease [Rhodococcus ruber]